MAAKKSEEGLPRHEGCGGVLKDVEERIILRVRGRPVAVDERFLRCGRCGEELVPPAHDLELDREAASRFLEDRGRISPRRIRALREALGVTQDFFEKAIGLPKKTVVRWESGRVFPSKAVDALLRLLERDRSAFGYLCREHGCELPGRWTEEPKSETNIQDLTERTSKSFR
jgi:putative zinc finger/helix-turn-helix YgiT family protein